ncbi:unnamed protein product [Rotaria sordida]|uniref:Uncharacterized protein n=1 Tax=Rotaria sordida TaxID=392033 RepID=A0A814FJK0_9BILA|nr:unnamed protein product [Rotaria sordida]CAF4036306.1 unnamed protein product [Rotaria sordida]
MVYLVALWMLVATIFMAEAVALDNENSSDFLVHLRNKPQGNYCNDCRDLVNRRCPYPAAASGPNGGTPCDYCAAGRCAHFNDCAAYYSCRALSYDHCIHSHNIKGPGK